MRGNKTEPKCASSESRWKWCSRTVLILLTCMLAAACSTRGTVRTAGVPAELLELLQPLPKFDPALMQPGPDSLPLAKRDDVPTLIRNHVDSAEIYHDVRESHAGLIEQAKARETQEAERIERARQAIDRTK